MQEFLANAPSTRTRSHKTVSFAPVVPVVPVVNSSVADENEIGDESEYENDTAPEPVPLSHAFIVRQADLTATTTTSTPKTVKQALAGPDAEQWKAAIDKENNSFITNNVLQSIQLRTPDMKVIGIQPVFRKKSDGTHKVRFTARGDMQKAGIDYDEVFAPVARYETLRTLLAVSALKDFVIHQMDVDTAFLYGVLDKEHPVFVALPPFYPIPDEFKDIDRNQLCARAFKAIYGLKASNRIWSETLKRVMVSLGFVQTDYDPCLFSKSSGGEVIYILIYVDDQIIGGSNLNVVLQFKDEMKGTFMMKDLGNLKHCLGIDVTRDDVNGSISLNQTRYALDVLERFNMSDCVPQSLPMIPNTRLSKAMSPKTPAEIAKAQRFPFREIVGSVMFLIITTRPDMAFAGLQLSMFMNCHGPQHHAAALHLLAYLKGTVNLGLTYTKTNNWKIHGFSDSDWANNVDTRKSVGGYAFLLSNCAISWRSKNQETVALSSTEAEYMALSNAIQEAMSLTRASREFNLDETSPMVIYEDNTSTIGLAANPVLHQRTKC
jgi:hypothetical protein